MDFLILKLKEEYRNEEQIVELVNNFKTRVDEDDVDSEDYHEFLSNFGSYLDIEKPSFISNINYFLNFQLSKMYFRYFMWNFSGRQNDKQWKYDLENGNWLSGINLIDNNRLGPQENLPDDVINNKARNKYFMIPFILGLIGFVFLFKENFKSSMANTIIVFIYWDSTQVLLE